MYYIGTDEDAEDDENIVTEKPDNKPPGFKDVVETAKELIEQDKPFDIEKVNKPEDTENTYNPWALMQKSIQSEDIKSFQGVKRSLAKALLASGNNDGFDKALEMVKCWCNAGYNLPRLKTLVSKTQNEYLFPPKVPIENDTSSFGINGKRNPKKKPYLFEILVDKMIGFKDGLNKDLIEFCVRKTLNFILIGTEGSVKGKSRFDEWKASYEPTKRTKKNQNTPDLPPNEIVYNYLPEGLREEEATTESPAMQNLSNVPTSESSKCLNDMEKEENHDNDDIKGKLGRLICLKYYFYPVI